MTNSTTRDEFEAWANTQDGLCVSNGILIGPQTITAFAAYLAARRAALLEAAAIFQKEIDHSALNDTRLPPDFGKAQGVLAIRASYVEAAVGLLRALADKGMKP